MSRPHRFVYVVGARPNFVKAAPLIAELRTRFPDARHVLVHTGQHYDRMLSGALLEDVGMPEPDHYLAAGSGTHAVQTARIMIRIERVLDLERPDLAIVPGDVNSTLAATLVAAKLQIPLAHIESGLRSFDRSMPEEINRIVADEFARHLFAHCDDAVANLLAEGIDAQRIHLVGNTMIDSLRAVEERFRALEAWRRHGLAHRGYLLVTLHRPGLVDGPMLRRVMDRLGDLARDLPVLFPVHPRTRRTLEVFEVRPGIRLVEPVGYLEFLSLEADAAAVLTDSGGVQEETTCLGVPCFTLRDSTERPVTIRMGTNTLLGLDPDAIERILPALAGPRRPHTAPPLWDGGAAARAADVIERAVHHVPAVVA
jgi:UDP-N-acetylglucosamine 2-epimerase (non-hydrolysing)